jgi:hypothetical protein
MVVFPALVHDANHLRSNNAADQAPSLLIAVTLANQPFIGRECLRRIMVADLVVDDFQDRGAQGLLRGVALAGSRSDNTSSGSSGRSARRFEIGMAESELAVDDSDKWVSPRSVPLIILGRWFVRWPGAIHLRYD